MSPFIVYYIFVGGQKIKLTITQIKSGKLL